MPLRKPDIYEHNNPNLPIVDSDFVKGGIRSAVQSLSDLYALTGKSSQLKQHSTQIYVSGENKFYGLKDITNIGNSTGWEATQVALPSGLVYTTGNQTISGKKIYAENATFLDKSVFQKESNFYEKLILTNRNWSNTYSISGSGVNDQIGKTVYLNKDGNVLIASSSPSNSSVGGPVYIYTGFNNTWNLKQTITGNSFNSSLVGDRFEMSSDNTVLCISFANVGNKLHIFTGSRDLGWDFKQTITGNYTFGHRFAMDDNGETIAVSTHRFGDGIGETGKVDIFTGSKNTTWNLKQSITGEGLNQLFGSSVSLSKDAKVLAIGAVFSGRAYTYVGNPIDGWLPQQIFTTNAIQQPAIGFGQFGSKLLLNNSGTVLIISHSNEDNYRGALYFYTGSNTNSWNLVDKVIGFTGFDMLGFFEGLVSNSDASIVVPTAPGYNGIGGHYSLILQKSIIENRWFIQQKIDTNQDLRANTASTINGDASIIAFSSPYFNSNNSPLRYGNGLIQLYTDINPNSLTLGNIYPEDFARIDGTLKIVGNLNLTGNLNINGNFNTNVTPTVNNSGLALLDRSVQTDSDARIVSLRFTQTGDNFLYSDPAPRIRTKFVSGGYDRIQVTHGVFSNKQILEVWESGVILNHRPTVNGTGVLLIGDANPGSSLINTTYSTLTGLKAAGELTPGQLYRISDFHLTWHNQSINDTGVKSGLAPEPLIVLALSGNEISHEAKSEIYPQDTVYYDIDASGSYSWGYLNINRAIPNFKGWIYRRIDHKLNIDIGWDWRNITVNCCRPIVTGVPIWTRTTNYNQFSVVRGTGINNTGKLYYSRVVSNSGNVFTNISFWSPVSDFVEGNTYFSTDESFGFRAYNNNDITFVNLPADQSTRIQQPTFTSSLTGQGTFSLTNCNNIKIEGGYCNVIFGNNFYQNTIGNTFAFNTIDSDFYSNTIGDDFYLNTIGDVFEKNTIGNSFNNNTIERLFRYNTIGNIFEKNTICQLFYYNTIGNFFNLNNIGNGFNLNTVGNGLSSNVIGNDSYGNAIGNDFYFNTIGNFFDSNIIGNIFNSNTIGNGFQSNTIANDFELNTIGNFFFSNTIGNNFYQNTIGNFFSFNTIGNIFNSNTIGNNFKKNTVEDLNVMGNITGATHIYTNYNTRIFTNSNNTVRLSYFNNNDQLVVTDPTA
jgi:hypothetical protein